MIDCRINIGTYTTVKNTFKDILNNISEKEIKLLSSNLSAMVDKVFQQIKESNKNNLLVKEIKSLTDKQSDSYKTKYYKVLFGTILAPIVHNDTMTKEITGENGKNLLENLKKNEYNYPKIALSDVTKNLITTQEKIFFDMNKIDNAIRQFLEETKYSNKQNFEEIVPLIKQMVGEKEDKLIQAYIYLKTNHLPFKVNYEGDNPLGDKILHLDEANFELVRDNENENNTWNVMYNGDKVGTTFPLDLDTTLTTNRNRLKEFGVQDAEIEQGIKQVEMFRQKLNANSTLKVKMGANNRKGYIQTKDNIDYISLKKIKDLQLEENQNDKGEIEPTIRIDTRPFITYKGGSIDERTLNVEIQTGGETTTIKDLLMEFKDTSPYTVLLDIEGNSKKELLNILKLQGIVPNPAYMRPFTFYSYKKIDKNFDNTGRLMINEKDSLSTTITEAVENTLQQAQTMFDSGVTAEISNAQINKLSNFFLNNDIAQRLIKTITKLYTDKSNYSKIYWIKEGIEKYGNGFFDKPTKEMLKDDILKKQNFWATEGVYYYGDKQDKVFLSKGNLMNLLSKMMSKEGKGILRHKLTNGWESGLVTNSVQYGENTFQMLVQEFADLKLLYNFDLNSDNKTTEDTLNSSLTIKELKKIVKELTGKEVTIKYGGIPQKPNLSFDISAEQETYPNISKEQIMEELSRYNADTTIINVNGVEINIEPYLQGLKILGDSNKNLDRYKKYIVDRISQKSKNELKFCII